MNHSGCSLLINDNTPWSFRFEKAHYLVVSCWKQIFETLARRHVLDMDSFETYYKKRDVKYEFRVNNGLLWKCSALRNSDRQEVILRLKTNNVVIVVHLLEDITVVLVVHCLCCRCKWLSSLLAIVVMQHGIHRCLWGKWRCWKCLSIDIQLSLRLLRIRIDSWHVARRTRITVFLLA